MNLRYEGVLVGIAIVLIPALLMGNTNYQVQKQNVYELHTTQHGERSNSQGFVINTVTGETWFLQNGFRSKSEEK